MKRITRFKKRTWILTGVVAAIAAMATVGAYAYWTQGGSGPGSATAGTTTAITVNQTSTTSSSLYPGGPTEALSGNFDNPNSGGVVISSVTAVVSSVTGGAEDGGKPACTAADFYISGTAAGSTVPSGTGVGSWSGLSIGLANRDGNANPPSELSPSANQDNCKSAVAHITYTANP
jgi:hypothetical protein